MAYQNEVGIDEKIIADGAINSGSSSVGANNTGVSIGGPITTTSGWSTGVAKDNNKAELASKMNQKNQRADPNDFKLYSNRMKSKENEPNFTKKSLLKTSKYAQDGSLENKILKSYLNEEGGNYQLTNDNEEAVQKVLQQIMFQSASMPAKTHYSGQNRQRAMTVGEGT